ncbi:MAG: RagB/SusD family nutrient uptake outer membrane protein [Muribaculaceae bacterium]|uniref:RagB/SusD family nutrient uptake outer membrane protein n=1 Tax=Duncaniella dubosii TaxID=2518971 RepID=UPI001A2EA72D|nr:RagB/SusD family nutrient uptake outer membrane protein [Duncaniella dubosii]MBJ2189569.1 RagB/SusD family nutrient uptake outer membrane protein [Muribaculaceae bacterium]MCX4285556.1 RagB/SusD family nutrient uptake outer membrane protein [Duncaniella dubosii]
MTLKNIMTAALVCLTFTACSDDFLENKPQGPLSEGNMNNPQAVDLLVSGAYATFGCRYADSNDPHWYPVTNWSYGEVRADNAYKGGGGETDAWEIHDMETAKIQPNNGFLDGKWFNVYCGISRCNSAIRSLNKVDENLIPEKNIRIAEVKVIRSHWYFELVRLFNRIPYMDINLPENEYQSVRNDEFTREQHLARIAGELLEAAEVLPETQTEIGRVNRRIALAYAAKVKLYQAYEQDPQTNAVININKSLLQEVVNLIDQVQGYDLLADFQQLDLLEYENGPESVFAIQFSKDDGSSGVGRINWSMLLNSMTGPGCPWQGDGFFLPSQDLINAYQTDENGLPLFDYQNRPDYGNVVFDSNGGYTLGNVDGNVDPRLDFVIGRPTIRYKTYSERPCGLWVRNSDTYGYNNTKRFWLSPESPDATQGWPWGASALNWQLIRYADLLLYKAEALIEIGGSGLEEARTLINRVRTRAMNSDYVKDFYDQTKDAANYKIGLYPASVWNQDYARQALRTEMRLEKAMEGERFFDLVRWGIAKETMNNYFAAEKDNRIYYQNASFETGEEYFPVPVAQYNFSGGIYVQNPGYPSF